MADETITRTLALLAKLNEDAAELLQFGANVSGWNHRAKVIFERVFGNMREPPQITRYLPIQQWGTGEDVCHSVHKADVDSVRKLIEAVCWEIEEFGVPPLINSVEHSPIVAIENVCQKFHRVCLALQKRHSSRPTLQVSDEYDVQDLLGALLALYFDDIRREEATPSFAAKSARMDFLLKKERIIVECKMSRPGLDAKKLGEELTLDKAKYKVHPDCQLLFCLVYDPGNRITNPRGIEQDLSESNKHFSVSVRIVP